jgi:hypothetical protein
MSMLYNKIKFDINMNNDEPLKTIWKHIKEIKKGQGDIIKLINLHPLYHYSYLFLTFSKWSLNLIFKKITIKMHSINSMFFPHPRGYSIFIIYTFVCTYVCVSKARKFILYIINYTFVSYGCLEEALLHSKKDKGCVTLWPCHLH